MGRIKNIAKSVGGDIKTAAVHTATGSASYDEKGLLLLMIILVLWFFVIRLKGKPQTAKQTTTGATVDEDASDLASGSAGVVAKADTTEPDDVGMFHDFVNSTLIGTTEAERNEIIENRAGRSFTG